MNTIFTNIIFNNKTIRAVYAFSKTGNIFAIDVNKCKFIFNKVANFEIINTEVPNNAQTYADHQIKILKPEPLLDQKYNLEDYLKKGIYY